nr:energy-coupling factor transporter transmembrane component T [Flexivirga meconopsidis]
MPRSVHPVAWWIWALGLAVAAACTTNPILLLLLIGVSCFVVLLRRGDAPWSRSLRVYLALGAAIVAIRMLFRVLLGGPGGGTVLIDLPSIPLPSFAAGIHLLGPIYSSSLLDGLYDGLHLAAMVVCLGAANSLANPKRLLKSVPMGLYDIGTVVVVAVSVFPQLAESLGRVRRAQRLRHDAATSRRHLVRMTIVPVLADALDRSLALAAAMDSRGYGRHGSASSRRRLLTGAMTIVGLIGVCVGAYGLFDERAPETRRWPVFIAGLVLGVAGVVVSSIGRRVTRYRPDPFDLSAIGVAAGGALSAALMVWATDVAPADLHPDTLPATWPVFGVLPLVAACAGLLAVVASPAPVLSRTREATA